MHPLMYVENETLKRLHDHDMTHRELIHLSRAINVMLEAARLSSRPYHDYFREHLGTISGSTEIEQLERIITRSDFPVSFIRARGGGPELYATLMKWIPQLRSFLT